MSIWNPLKFIPSGYPTAFRIQKWNCPWCRKKPLFQNFIGWKTFIVFTFAPYILTKLTDFLQTKRDMCLRGLVWAWAAKPSWDLSTGCCCYWAIFDTTVEFSFSSFIGSMVFCYQNCSDLLWEKNILVIENNFWNLRLKAGNFQNFWDH